MEYDAAGRVIRLTSENGSHTTFRYDVLDRLIQETGFDGRTQRYHHDLTGKLIRSEDEGLVTHWHYDEADRLTHRTVKGETAEQWQYDERGWLTDISHISEGHRVAVHYRYDEKGRLTGERQTVHHPQTEALLWQHETRHAYNAQGLANRVAYRQPARRMADLRSGHSGRYEVSATHRWWISPATACTGNAAPLRRYELITAYTRSYRASTPTACCLTAMHNSNDNGELHPSAAPHRPESS